MIGEVIVWSGFTSASLKRESMITDFITSKDSILFEILLHPGNTAAHVWDHSMFTSESEILIAASSVFMVESVESIDIAMEMIDNMTQLMIPLVKLIYWMSWPGFDIDERLATILL
jgi:prephenate dehydrogenase